MVWWVGKLGPTCGSDEDGYGYSYKQWENQWWHVGHLCSTIQQLSIYFDSLICGIGWRQSANSLDRVTEFGRQRRTERAWQGQSMGSQRVAQITEQLNLGSNNGGAPASTLDASRTGVPLPLSIPGWLERGGETAETIRCPLPWSLALGKWIKDFDQLDLNTAGGIRFETSAAWCQCPGLEKTDI